MNLFAKITLVALLCCQFPPTGPNPYSTVGDIPAPPGFRRLPPTPGDFISWLRQLPLKKDRTVFLYNGQPKRNQDAQFAVLDVTVGHQDLQQCADAVMRLRAEYLYAQHRFPEIDFYSEQGVRLNFSEWAGRHHGYSRATFDNYLANVFNWCSTRTLEKALKPRPFSQLSGGDVLIRGGSPGHAMLITDVAEDAQGHRIYLLAQSYMPAQDIHIVKNPTEPTLSPWYRANQTGSIIETPEYTFTTNQLRTWPKKP
jgi:Domain of unknown function (4846)